MSFVLRFVVFTREGGVLDGVGNTSVLLRGGGTVSLLEVAVCCDPVLIPAFESLRSVSWDHSSCRNGC